MIFAQFQVEEWIPFSILWSFQVREESSRLNVLENQLSYAKLTSSLSPTGVYKFEME